MKTRRPWAAAAAIAMTVLSGCSSAHSHESPAATHSARPPQQHRTDESTALRSEDQSGRNTGLPSATAYTAKWSYLQRVCTQQGAALKAIVEGVYKAQHEPNRYQAMNYMSGLQDAPQSSCAAFAKG